MKGFMAVSPSVIFDGDIPYLVYGHRKVYVARLKPNMVELAEEPVEIKIPADFIESPIIVKINGKFYFTYSSGGLWGDGFRHQCHLLFSLARYQ